MKFFNTLCMILLLNSLLYSSESDSYTRASLHSKKFENKLFRTNLNIKWEKSEKYLWYKVLVAAKKIEYFYVDLNSGKKELIFDVEKLVSSLNLKTKNKIDVDQFKINTLYLSNDYKNVTFKHRENVYTYNRKTHTLTTGGDFPETESHSLNRIEASKSMGAECHFSFSNTTKSEVKVFWVDFKGRKKQYAVLEPGGKWEQNTFEGHVWLVTNSQNKNLKIVRASGDEDIEIKESDGVIVQKKRQKRKKPGVSNDGKWRAFIKNDNLYLQNLESKKEFALSKNGKSKDPYTRFYFSPDSKYIMCIQNKKTEMRKVHFVESSPKDQVQPKLHAFNYRKPGDKLDYERPRLFSVEKTSEIVVSEELFENPYRNSRWRWSSDSKSFTFLHNRRGHQILRLVSIAINGKAHSLIEEKSETFIHYSQKTYLNQNDKSNEIIWMSERDGWNHLYLFDSKTGENKSQITKGEWPVKKVFRVDFEKRKIWFTATGVFKDQDPYHVHNFVVDFNGKNLTHLTEGDGTHEIKYSPSGNYYIDRYSRVDLPRITELRRAENGSLICELEKGDHRALLRAGWRAPVRFNAKGRDGKSDIWGFVVLPTNFDKDKKYPVIEQIYAGPHGAHVPKSFRVSYGTMKIAELGFICVQIDGMGTNGRSKSFHDICWQNLSDGGFPDRILWMKAASKKFPQMDLNKVGIYGGSAGGQNALSALLNFGDFYKAAAADCGCHDNRMDKIWWNEQWMGEMGSHYKEQSNVTQAHKLKGKLLLMVGELDRNVDPASTMQVVDALIKANKDFELIVFPGAGHGAGGSRYGKRRMYDFFIKHLQN